MIRKLFSSTTIAFILLLCSCDCAGPPLSAFLLCDQPIKRRFVTTALLPLLSRWFHPKTGSTIHTGKYQKNLRLKNFLVLLNGCCDCQHLTPQLNHTCFKLTKKYYNISNLIYLCRQYNIRKLLHYFHTKSIPFLNETFYFYYFFKWQILSSEYI